MKFSYSETKMGQALASIFFLLLFPGFYFYHQGVAMLIIPRFLGGFFSPIALLSVAAFVLVARDLAKRVGKTKGFSLLLIGLFIWILIVATSEIFLVDFEYNLEMYYQVMNTLLLWGALFIIGVYLEPESKSFKFLIYASSILIALGLIAYVISTGSFFYYARQLSVSDEAVATYQGFARSALVLLLLFYSYEKKIFPQIAVVFVSIFVLFVLGARSEFAAFILSLIGFSLVRSLMDRRIAIVMFAAFVLVSASIVFFSEEIIHTRQAHLLDLSQSSSWAARQDLKNRAVERIKSNPFLGDVSGHIKEGGAGAYSHNMLSAWDAFGIIGFILYASSMAWPAWKAITIMLKRSRISPLETFFCLLTFACLILVLASKSIYWPLPSLVWGLYVNVTIRIKYRDNGGYRTPYVLS